MNPRSMIGKLVTFRILPGMPAFVVFAQGASADHDAIQRSDEVTLLVFSAAREDKKDRKVTGLTSDGLMVEFRLSPQEFEEGEVQKCQR